MTASTTRSRSTPTIWRCSPAASSRRCSPRRDRVQPTPRCTTSAGASCSPPRPRRVRRRRSPRSARPARLRPSLDDVLAARARPRPCRSTTCVVLPRPHRATLPAARVGDVIRVDGLVSARIDTAERVDHRHRRRRRCGVELVDRRRRRVRTAPASTRPRPAAAPYRRASADGSTRGPDAGRPTRSVRGRVRETNRAWAAAVAAARVALAHQLIAASRWMLDAGPDARASTVSSSGDRSRRSKRCGTSWPNRSWRSRLPTRSASACTDDVDPLLAAVAKSLAGKAARTTATNAQQVLAGIGFTTDHAFHRWLKRTLVVDTVFGSASSIPTEIGYRTPRRRWRAAAARVVTRHHRPRRCRGTPTPGDPANTMITLDQLLTLLDRGRPDRSGRSDALAGRHARARRRPRVRRPDDRPGGRRSPPVTYPDMAVKSVDVVFPEGCPRHRGARATADPAARRQRRTPRCSVDCRSRARRRRRPSGTRSTVICHRPAPGVEHHQDRCRESPGGRTTPARSTSG